MTTSAFRLLAAAIAGFMGLAGTAQAESFASSASSAGSASIGSLSDSLQASSNSSTRNNRVAEGDYRVIEVAEAPGKPGQLRVKLHAVRAEDEFLLDVPQSALRERGLSAGDVVAARERPYGYEFAHADTRQAFFLVLADDWRRELDPRPVGTL